jgi:hypothetical protein
VKHFAEDRITGSGLQPPKRLKLGDRLRAPQPRVGCHHPLDERLRLRVELFVGGAHVSDVRTPGDDVNPYRGAVSPARGGSFALPATLR